ncbi:MAG: cyclic pyranopterin monophosphate synthase MoaC [bacterium]|nr:cyclic pyranopterin monophosphate synthase MoaC [bacterium]
MTELTHLDDRGRARMVDVGDKESTRREVAARARVRMPAEAFQALTGGGLAKGDALGVAQVAGILAAKRTPELIPLCHPIPLDAVEVSLEPEPVSRTVSIEATVRSTGKTGAEMEALTAAAVAGLALYDMVKALGPGTVLQDVRLVAKSGGKSGAFRRGRVVAVCTSPGRGERKHPRSEGVLRAGHGLEGDGHGGDPSRQVSLLARESIQKMRDKGLEVGPGDFAENLTTEGIDLVGLAVGDRLELEHGALLEITQIGKECHERCAIYYQAGDCVMPREGVFARVLRGGAVRPGDQLRKG